MSIRLGFYSLIILLLLAVLPGAAPAQFATVSGTVYDVTARRPLEAVAVQSSSGRGTITDSAGRYLLVVPVKDSIWFSMIGKTTQKYAVDTISNLDHFNVMIHMRATELPAVKVRNNYYRYDSMMNRQDYTKVFNFKKPTLGVVSNPTYNPGAAVGFDLESIINMFRVKHNRSILTLQKRLLEQEQENYVNSRFSKQFVRKITKLQSPDLDTFMRRFRPGYELVKILNDLELGYWVTKNLEIYQSSRFNWRGGFNRRKDE
ncbi:MAG TPA: hypothetical protein VJ552_03270 [Sediminibacterium sp.]|nr:hypothetical protein [Sediminibacterium sp.]